MGEGVEGRDEMKRKEKKRKEVIGFGQQEKKLQFDCEPFGEKNTSGKEGGVTFFLVKKGAVEGCRKKEVCF